VLVSYALARVPEAPTRVSPDTVLRRIVGLVSEDPDEPRSRTEAMLGLENPSTYTRVGAIYILLSLPAWGLLAAGRLFDIRNFYLLISLMGLPLGALFLVFGTRRRPINSRSGTALRLAYMALAFILFLFVFELMVKSGAYFFLTAVLFCAMAGSFLSILTLVFLVAALRPDSPPGS